MQFTYKIGDIFRLVGGGTPSTSKMEYWSDHGTPWISSADIATDGSISIRKYVTDAGINNSTTNVLPKDAIIVVTRVGLGKVATLPCEMCYSQDIQGLIAKPTCPEYDTAFLKYQIFKDMQTNKFEGRGTTISGITKKMLADIRIWIPPLPEQERIVARIEELFSELDSGVETLRTVKEQLKVYRQAVLKEAFEGCHEKKPIREMSNLVTSGSRGWAKYYSDEGARFIRITDLTRDRIMLQNDSVQRVCLPEKAEGLRSRLQENDVLVSITADLGSIALVPNGIGEAYINQHIAMIRFKNSKQGEFMAWYLRSEYGQKDLLKNKRGGGKLGLGLDDIRDTFVPVVTDETAAKVVEDIDSKMSVCDEIEKTVDAALQQSAALRQSILKQAFEGILL